MILLLGPLICFMIVAAVVALETRHLLSAVIAVGAVGFGLSFAFIVLGAPDIAITQIVVEVLVLVMLIRGTVGRDVHAEVEAREHFATGAALVLLLLLFILAGHALSALPPFGQPAALAGGASEAYIAGALSDTGAANVVASILLDFRGYDTLGEATVLFAAIVGALAVLRRPARTDEGGGGEAKR